MSDDLTAPDLLLLRGRIRSAFCGEVGDRTAVPPRAAPAAPVRFGAGLDRAPHPVRVPAGGAATRSVTIRGVDLTPLQRVTLHRLVGGGQAPESQPRVALRWLRRYGLVDADGCPTGEGRAYLVELREQAQRRKDAHHAEVRRQRREDPLWGVRDAIRRWKAGERDR